MSVPPTGTNELLFLSRKRKPSSDAIPAPQSLVALPPRPKTIRFAPRFTASRISIPTPAVVVTVGSTLSPASGSPAQEAVSITAAPLLSI